MLPRVSDLEGFFGTILETEKGYEIWYMECNKSL
jgi:hypothetical protein